MMVGTRAEPVARRVAKGLAAVFLWAIAGASAAAEGPDLGARLDAALDARALRGARVAAFVVDDETGSTLYARTPDRALIPASNLKVLTALAALRALGPTWRYETQILADAAPEDGAVRTLYVRGSGDPGLTSEDLWRLAADLRRAGLRRVAGDLVLDDSVFDGRRWHPSWGPTGARAYHAPVGGLTVNYGAFAVVVAPGSGPGEALRAVVDPPVPYLALTLRGRTGPARTRSSLIVDRQAGAGDERVIVSGAFPVDHGERTLHRSVLDPARYAGAVLRAQLESLDIPIEGGTRLGYVPQEAVPLLDFEGRPLSELVRRFLKYSNNQMGEALVKTLGARAEGTPGTWSSGVAAVRAELDDAGLPLEDVVLVDGSGLSYENRVTPRLLVTAVRTAASDFRFGPEFLAALPIAAADGTLEERAEEAVGRVRAKTGLLTRVTGLSGFALGAEGRRLAFSVLVNGFRGSAKQAMDAVDGFAEVLASGPGPAAQDSSP